MATFHRRRHDASDASGGGGGGDPGMWIPGLGENKPRPRELGTMFGYVPDAFQNDLPELPSESASRGSREGSAGASSAGGGGGAGSESGIAAAAAVVGAGAVATAVAASSAGGDDAASSAAGSASPRPSSAAETADDSSQMRDALFQPSSPDTAERRKGPMQYHHHDRERQPVEEEECVAVDAGRAPEATPFFDNQSRRKILIRGGTVVNCDGSSVCDVLIDGDKISAVGPDLPVPQAGEGEGEPIVIEAEGKMVMPGGVDAAVHLHSSKAGEIGMADDFSSGTRAALAGGTTTVVDLVEPAPEQGMGEALNEWREEAEEKACCDFAFRVALPGWGEEVKREMEELAKKEGVNAFKISLWHRDPSMQFSTCEAAEAMSALRAVGAVAAVHAENGEVVREGERRLLARGMAGPESIPMSRPEEAEEEAVTRAASVARQAGVPMVICGGPTSRAGAAAAARAGGVCWAEAPAAALAATGAEYYGACWDRAAGFAMAPPLRDDPSAPAALARALADESGAFKVVTSEHRSFSMETKAAAGRGNFVNIPLGVNGVEERVAIAWEKMAGGEKAGAEAVAAVTSSNAAKALGVYPRKGRVAEGSDADVAVWNPNNLRQISAKTQQQRGDFNVFEGETVRMAPEYVVCGGRVCVFEYRLNAGMEGQGRRVDLPLRPPALYDGADDLLRADEARQVPVDRREDNFRATAANEMMSAAPPPPSSKDFGVTTPRRSTDSPVLNKRLGIYQRPISAHGVRNQQDSTFSLTGDVPNDRRSSVKVSAPPGGGGRGGFW